MQGFITACVQQGTRQAQVACCTNPTSTANILDHSIPMLDGLFQRIHTVNCLDHSIPTLNCLDQSTPQPIFV